MKDNKTDISAENIQMNMKEEGEEKEDAINLKPIARLLIEYIIEIRWFANDIFLIALTANNELFILDQLLYPMRLIINSAKHIR